MPKNITLSLDDDILAEIRIAAAAAGLSVSGYVALCLADRLRSDAAYLAAKDRSLALIRKHRIVGGLRRVSRDVLHER